MVLILNFQHKLENLVEEVYARMRDKSYLYKRTPSGTLVSTGRLVDSVHGSSITMFKKKTGN